MSVFSQDGYAIRFDWGLEGLKALAPVSDVLIIVDVLSFSTCVCVGVERGASVYPFKYRDDRAMEFASQQGAILAGSRSGNSDISLSPRSLVKLKPGDKVVLPSPNGSHLSAECSTTQVLAGCLRNATAIARASMNIGKVVAVIGAGERWKETGLLRPAFEDLVGAGGIIHAINRSKSPEALAAEAVFISSRGNLESLMRDCASGRQLIGMGYPEDVSFSAELDVTRAVPILRDGAYVSNV